MKRENIDLKTVDGFGDEWKRFDQSMLPIQEQEKIFNDYFSIFPWALLAKDAIGFDMGCGTGRWAEIVASRVKLLHCIDPSVALDVAKVKLKNYDNCVFHNATTDSVNIDHSSMDFGYSLGVLHHIPNTPKALKDCVELLKPGAPFLVYLYYAFDNKPFWFKTIFKGSNFLRLGISKLPHSIRYLFSQILALGVYLPLARFSLLIDKMGINTENIPLSAYRNCSFYTMRTDSLDRFGTRLEQRFTKKQIEKMMLEAGLRDIVFNNSVPYWCAVGIKN
jgi:ubiquinone/menaquinone biosynthesis C-methylase UbiE